MHFNQLTTLNFTHKFESIPGLKFKYHKAHDGTYESLEEQDVNTATFYFNGPFRTLRKTVPDVHVWGQVSEHSFIDCLFICRRGWNGDGSTREATISTELICKSRTTSTWG